MIITDISNSNTYAVVDYIESMLLGNQCGMRGTSCADQLAKAVREAYENSK